MALVHVYMGIENLNLNATQRQTLVTALRSLGPGSHSQPSHINHWRTRLDNDAAIFEALFDEDHLTIVAFKQRLASIFNVDVALITHSVSSQSFGGGTTTIVTFAYLATNRLRVALFGGVGATRAESGNEVRGYLAANAAAWGDA